MKKIRTQNNKRLMAIALILLMVISIGYAALTTTLTINGTANIGSSSWLVYFTNVVPNANNNVAQVVTEPSTTGKETTTLNWAVNMDTPGQKYEFTVDAVNEGSIDAMIATETENLITQGLSANQKKYLDYTVTYINGAPVEKNDKLSAGETKTLKVKLEFKTDVAAEDLPTDAQTINLSYSIDYVQADGSAVEKNTKVSARFVDGLSGKTHSFGTYSQVTKIERASELPDTYKNDSNIVSTEDSYYPIYMWNENNVLYWYSEAEHPELPANSSGIFGSFSNLADASGIRDWDTSNVIDMTGMFNGCLVLTTLDLSKFDTKNVENMWNLFAGCYELTALDLSNFDTTNVIDMGNMFVSCHALVNLDLSSFDTSKVTNMENMFSSCYELTNLDLSSFDTSNVTDMSNMFNMNSTSGETSKLKKIIVSDKFAIDNVTDSGNMFKDCTALRGGNGTTYNSSKIDAIMAHIDTAENPGYFTLVGSPLTIGDSVRYITTLNGVTLDKWSIFYVDGDYTYIILDDYLPNVAIDTNKAYFNKLSKNGDYSINVSSSESGTDLEKRTYLINALSTKSNWDSLLIGTINGHEINETRSEHVYAIGAPDLELWKNSWNTTYSEDTIYTKYANNLVKDSITYDGWYIGNTANPSTYGIAISEKEGYNNTLYYPHKELIDSNKCYGYWLASPSASSYRFVVNVYCGGDVNLSGYTSVSFAARPVISLPTSIVNQ